MPTKATAGLKPCATVDEPSGHTNGGCEFCGCEADGYDAVVEAPLCEECAEAFASFRTDVLGVTYE